MSRRKRHDHFDYVSPLASACRFDGKLNLLLDYLKCAMKIVPFPHFDDITKAKHALTLRITIHFCSNILMELEQCMVVFLHADEDEQGISEKTPLRRVKLRKIWGISSPFLNIIQHSKRSVDDIFHRLLDEPDDLLRKSGGHLQLYFRLKLIDTLLQGLNKKFQRTFYLENERGVVPQPSLKPRFFDIKAFYPVLEE